MITNPKFRAWLVDAGERVGFTFLAAFLAVFGVGDVTSLINGHLDRVAFTAAVSAGVAAVLTLIKTVVAAKLKGTVSPASFAPQQQPGQALQDAPSDEPSVVRTVILPETFIQGKSLGRHIHHDERSRAFAVTPQSTPLKSVRHKRLTPIFDQGQIGSCTGNACAGALSTAPFTHRFKESTALRIYEAATAIDDVPGQYPPDDTGSDGLSVAKVAKANGWISSYQHCFSLDAVLTALQTGPVLLGVSWRSGFDNPTPDGQMPYSGVVRGGHEIVADEIDVERKRVWITNSWGYPWALHGRAWWPWDVLAKILADRGDATVLIP